MSEEKLQKSLTKKKKFSETKKQTKLRTFGAKKMVKEKKMEENLLNPKKLEIKKHNQKKKKKGNKTKQSGFKKKNTRRFQRFLTTIVTSKNTSEIYLL